MKKSADKKTHLIWILILILAVGVILIAVLPARNIPPAAPATVNPNAPVYKGAVYPGFTWNDAVATTTSIYENGNSMDFTGTIIVSAPVTDVSDPASVSDPFLAYYDAQLTKTGWLEDKDLDADGPASSSRTYKKDDQVVILSYQSVLNNEQEGSPSTCPCDMTFSVFEGE